jgi:hypothetical protein
MTVVTGNFQDFVEMPFGQGKHEKSTWVGFWECHDILARIKGEWDSGPVHVRHIST